MSNLEKDPAEVLLRPGGEVRFDRLSDRNEASDRGGTSDRHPIEILEPRDVPLGGPRAMNVRRTLPQRARSLIGAWCFLDHYGPDPVSATGGMSVPPHPHTGLQTVSWLFAGEIEHRDSVGTHAIVRPGELNLMTAGRGIQHSEIGTPETRMLHGAQLWVALPDSDRHTAPAFENFVPEPFAYGEATIRVFLGELLGHRSTAHAYTAIVGAQLDLPAGATLTLPVDADFEHGILVDAGAPLVEEQPVGKDHLAFLPVGHDQLTISSGDEPLRALLIGGVPLGERILMWWNFVGRSHEEVVEYRRQWQVEVIAGGASTSSATGTRSATKAGSATVDGRFGHVSGWDGRALPAPELPNVRLRPRD